MANQFMTLINDMDALQQQLMAKLENLKYHKKGLKDDEVLKTIRYIDEITMMAFNHLVIAGGFAHSASLPVRARIETLANVKPEHPETETIHKRIVEHTYFMAAKFGPQPDVETINHIFDKFRDMVHRHEPSGGISFKKRGELTGTTKLQLACPPGGPTSSAAERLQGLLDRLGRDVPDAKERAQIYADAEKIASEDHYQYCLLAQRLYASIMNHKAADTRS
jgi:hypothetical protein